MIGRRQYIAFFLGCVLVVAPFFATGAYAQSEIEELQEEINERNGRLAEIEAEIAQYRQDLQKVGAEKNTLQKAINQLELERKKVEADIAYTQNKIGATDLEISKLSLEIGDTQATINSTEEGIKEILRRLNESDSTDLLVSFLEYKNIAELWEGIDQLEQVRSAMGNQVRSLQSQKQLLEIKHGDSEEKREELVDLKNQYTDQTKVLSNNKTSKATLLEQTKNEEAEYQRLLAEREAAREQIVKEMREFEAKLQFILDPTTIPSAGTAVFDWPLQSVVITQLFGGTEFAKQNASVYGNRAYHPGVDFGAARGTKIFAPLGGTVRATGNTDAFPGCYSWGKWTLIDHPNGLSTLYAHQDVQSVVPGQTVERGDVIGYTGNTGYTTGPHLHFTVYVTEGVSVRTFSEIKTVTSCGSATTPVAATDAYLDPMLYLPAQ